MGHWREPRPENWTTGHRRSSSRNADRSAGEQRPPEREQSHCSPFVPLLFPWIFPRLFPLPRGQLFPRVDSAPWENGDCSPTVPSIVPLLFASVRSPYRPRRIREYGPIDGAVHARRAAARCDGPCSGARVLAEIVRRNGFGVWRCFRQGHLGTSLHTRGMCHGNSWGRQPRENPDGSGGDRRKAGDPSQPRTGRPLNARGRPREGRSTPTVWWSRAGYFGSRSGFMPSRGSRKLTGPHAKS